MSQRGGRYEDLAHIDELLARSDQLMYRAKHSHRSTPLKEGERKTSAVPVTGPQTRLTASAKGR